MSSEWLRTTLADAPIMIMDGDRGTNYPSQDDFSQAGHCLFLNTGNVTTEGFNFSSCAFITAEKDSVLRKGKLVRDDVVLTTRGTVGNVAYFRASVPFEHLRINSGMVILRSDQSQLSSHFLYLFLRSALFMEQVKSLQSGSAQPQLPIRDMKRIEIPIPPVHVQSGICAVLGAFDDRITLLRENNATLEAIAQALFKSWFVDFDPVRAKMEGRAPEGMGEATAALFPDGFEESELGLVPRGWRVKPLDEVANFLNGLALQKFPPTDDAWLPVIKIAQLRKGDTVGADRAGRNLKPAYVIQNGDVLFSWSGSLEVEVWCGGEGALNQHLFKVTSDTYPKWFYYLWTKHHLEHFRQIAASKATTMGHIQRAHLSQAKAVVPPDDVVLAVGECFAPLLDRWIAIALQAQTLATLRDTLLPRLISGQLRLPEAEAQVEEATA